MKTSNPAHSWFHDARYGLFIHWGPYAQYARGEQVLMREMLDQAVYARRACEWNPQHFDAAEWARVAVEGGFRYAVLTTRHHDGYCLWDTSTTNYSSASQAPKRDFVREYLDAFRSAGLRVGLYYSWSDFRIPAMFSGPARDPEGWAAMRNYVHSQVEELLTRYGKIDQFWFDGAWPRSAAEWDSPGLVAKMRRWQPDMLINNRLGSTGETSGQIGNDEFMAHEVEGLGDFSTPEHHITPDSARLWESCQVSTWRLWSFTTGDRWRSAEQWLDMLTDAVCKGGNLLLNVGPDANGNIPPEFLERNRQLGDWLRVSGEAVYGADLTPCDLFESTLLGGRQVRRGDTLYIICRFWHGGDQLRLAGLDAEIQSANLLGSESCLEVSRDEFGTTLHGLPQNHSIPLFPVIKIVAKGGFRVLPAYSPGLWSGDPMRLHHWALSRGRGFQADDIG